VLSRIKFCDDSNFLTKNVIRSYSNGKSIQVKNGPNAKHVLSVLTNIILDNSKFVTQGGRSYFEQANFIVLSGRTSFGQSH